MLEKCGAGANTVGQPRKIVPRYCVRKAATMPINTAMPPIRGTVFLLMRLAPGLSTAPSVQATLFARGVTRSVVTSAAKNRQRWINHDLGI